MPSELRRLPFLLLLVLLLAPAWASAGEVLDATGRHVTLPATIVRVMPAGPPAAVLLAALAPDMMTGWPHPPGPAAAALLGAPLAALPKSPPLEKAALAAIEATHPDLIVDYGTISPRYVARAQEAGFGAPVLLFDGALDQAPDVLRRLGAALGRAARGEELARMADAILSARRPDEARRVIYARGEPDALIAAAPGSQPYETLRAAGWQVLAPTSEEGGKFRPVTAAVIAKLDPDVLILADPASRAALAKAPEWQAVRAVREGHAYIAPTLPFGWFEEPPSINRLLGLLWTEHYADPTALAARAASLQAELYGRAPGAADTAALRDALAPIRAATP